MVSSKGDFRGKERNLHKHIHMNFLEKQDKKYDEEVSVPDAQYLYPKDSSQKLAHVMRAADPRSSLQRQLRSTSHINHTKHPNQDFDGEKYHCF